MIRRLPVRLLLATALALPAANASLFDGLPLGGRIEVVALALVLPLFFASALRAEWLALFGRRTRMLVFALLIAAIAGKAALWSSGRAAGFRACYASPIATVNRGGTCERSYENPLFRFGATRLDRAIDFGWNGLNSASLVEPAFFYGATHSGITTTNWNLSFVNSLRFNLYEQLGDGITERVPLTVTWQGEVDFSAPTVLRIDYLGEGHLRVGSVERPLPANPTRVGQIDVPVPAGRQPFELRYVFDDGERQGRGVPPRGAYGRVRVTQSVPGDPRPRTVLETAPLPVGWRFVGWIVDACLLAVVLSMFVCYARRRWVQLFALAVAGVVALCWTAPQLATGLPVLVFPTALCGLILVMHKRPAWRSPLVAYAIVLCVQALRMYHDYPGFFTVLYRRPGADWLTYESFARDILETGSLEGGESWFYYQPGYRYFLFGLRVLLGDSDVLSGLAQLTAITWTAFFAYTRFAGSRLVPVRAGKPLAALSREMIWISALVTVALVNTQFVVNCVRVGASESPTWILLPLMGALLLKPRSRSEFVWGSVLAGASVFVRLTQAIGVAWLLGAASLKRTAGRLMPAVLYAIPAPLIVMLLVFAHNAAYSNHMTIVPASTAIPENVNLYLKDVVQKPVAEVASVLREQVAMMFYLSAHFDRPAVLTIALWGLLILWDVSLAAPIILRQRRTWWQWAVCLWPLGYLLPFLSWNPANFYPRQILIGFLAMGTAVMASSSWFDGRLDHEPEDADQDRGSRAGG